MSTTEAPVVALSIEDRARMARLYEEVQGRLAEMSLIVGRVLDLDTRDARLKFAPVENAKRDITFGEDEAIEIVCTPAGCGCYDHHAGTCGPC